MSRSNDDGDDDYDDAWWRLQMEMPSRRQAIIWNNDG